jgi:predicted nucleic acid-binding Zn finger protein
MQIITIKHNSLKTGLKVYGKVLGESGKAYSFAYIRRRTFRGWLCTCENFLFSAFKKNRNCKHLRFVRSQVGRYASVKGLYKVR